MPDLVYSIYGPTLSNVWRLFVASSAVWLPVALCYTAVSLWLYRARVRWIKGLEWITLEVKLPKEVGKTPAAMEFVLNAFSVPGRGDLINKWIKGEQTPWSSLEIASLGGQIHFFIRIQKGWKNRIESAIYSQYPSVEIFEAEDYTNRVPYGLPGADWELWGFELLFIKPDPYPIKTYVDYGIDKPSSPEESPNRIDPLTPLLEFMGTLKPGEQIWVQLLIRNLGKRFDKPKKWEEIWWQPSKWFEKQDWLKEAEKEISKLRKEDKEKEGKFVVLSPGQTEVLKSMERTLGKTAFDTGIRAIYLAQKEVFSGNNNGALVGSLMQFNSAALQSFKPENITGITYPWQDLTGRKAALKKSIMFDAYRRRSYFYPPYVRKPLVMSVEELATIYHFPGSVASTPSLGKIESKRSEPPINLPL